MHLRRQPLSPVRTWAAGLKAGWVRGEPRRYSLDLSCQVPAALSILWSSRVMSSYVNTLDFPHKGTRLGQQLGRAEGRSYALTGWGP